MLQGVILIEPHNSKTLWCYIAFHHNKIQSGASQNWEDAQASVEERVEW